MKEFRNVILTLVFLTTFSYASNPPLPTSVGALGDSLSAAALAAFTRTDIRNPFAFPKFLYFIGRYGYMQSVQAFESRDLSWTTGNNDAILSHAKRIAALSGKNVQAYNAAISGAGSWSLDDEIDDLVSWSKKNLKTDTPDYVTLEIGADDACINEGQAGSTPTADYAAKMQSAVNRLLQANPNVKILISGIPDVPKVKRTLENSSLGLLVFRHCSDIWKKLPYCQNILQSDDQDSLDESEALIDSYMHELDVITQNTNAKEGRDAIHFATDINTYPINEDEVSFDCFHPNKKGQALFSEVTWQQSWWSSVR